MKYRPSLLLATALLTVTLMGCDSPEEKHEKYMGRGNALYEQGEYDKARVEYKNAARIKPSDAEVRYRLGLIDEAQGRLREAFSQYIAAEQQNAHHRLALIKLGQYFLAGEIYDEAQKRVNTLLQDGPNDAEAHALAAALHLRHKEHELTEKEARLALQYDPNNVTAYTVLTGLYSAQNLQQKAAETVEAAIARNPKTVGLYLLKAMVYEKASNLDKITEAYKAIFNLKPTDARFRTDLAKVYLQADKIEEAEKVLREGVKEMPDNWAMKKRLVDFLNEKRGMDIAEQEIKGYMQAFPDNQELYFWLADLYIANKAVDRAIALLQQIVDRSKDDLKEKHSLTARTSLARIHFVKGDKNLADKLANAVLEQDPNNREALFVRANMLFDQGDYQEAVSSLRTIVRDAPDAADALQLLGETLLIQGYLDLAIDTFNQLAQAAPTNMPTKVRLAQLYGAHEDTPRALALLAIVTKIDPDYPVGWESTARIAIQTKDWSKAEAALQTLEKMEGQARTALFLRGQMAEAKGLADEATAFYAQTVGSDVHAPIAEHAVKAYVTLKAKSKQCEGAISYLQSLGQSTPLISTLMGDCYNALGKKDEALASYQAAIDAKAPMLEPYLSRARLLIADQKDDEALRQLEQAESIAHGDPRPMMIRADLLVKTGKHAEALALYELLLARNPRLDPVANNAAQLIADYMYTDRAALEKARVLAERFIRSSVPHFLDTLAWVYYRLGNTEQAQTIYERILAGERKLPAPVYYHYGKVLFESGRKDAAKDLLKKAVETDVPYDGLDEAKKMLATP